MFRRLVWYFILVSLLIHLGSYWVTYSISVEPTTIPRLSKTVEVDLVEKPPEKRSKPIPIRFADAPKELIDDSIEALKKKSELLSEKLQRVKKEMRASLVGMTKNSQLQKRQLSKNNAQASQKVEIPDLNANPQESMEAKKEMEASQNNPLDLSPSTFGNQLNKKLEVGQFTALNTDRHLFYSFYSRIEEMIRPPWEQQVSQESQRHNTQQTTRPRGGWATRIDVLLDPDGKLKKVVLLKSSGIEGYDRAAIDAFQRAGFFPHPPKEIVNADGVILLKYLFHVY